MTNERTSRRIASIAGRILERCKGVHGRNIAVVYQADGSRIEVANMYELKALAASALTQTKDRKRKKK